MVGPLYTTDSGLLYHAGKIIIVAVGLPARGKTHMCRAVERYLRWCGVKIQVVSLGDYRRKTVGGAQQLPPDYFTFGQKSPETAALRERVRNECEQLIMNFFDRGGQVAIYDANNGTRATRKAVAEKFTAKGIHVVFLESICNNRDIIEANIRSVKISSPDYKHWLPERAVQDYWGRIKDHEKYYEPVEELDWPSIRIFDVGDKVTLNNIQGYLQTRIVFFLMNIHNRFRLIYFARSGQSLIEHSYKADSDLSPAGWEYAERLREAVMERRAAALKERGLSEDRRLVIWTSTRRRAHHTAWPFASPNVPLTSSPTATAIDTQVPANPTFEASTQIEVFAPTPPEEESVDGDHEHTLQFPTTMIGGPGFVVAPSPAHSSSPLPSPKNSSVVQSPPSPKEEFDLPPAAMPLQSAPTVTPTTARTSSAATIKQADVRPVINTSPTTAKPVPQPQSLSPTSPPPASQLRRQSSYSAPSSPKAMGTWALGGPHAVVPNAGNIGPVARTQASTPVPPPPVSVTAPRVKVIEKAQMLEINPGIWDGLSPEDAKRLYPEEYERFVNDPYAFRAPRAESYHDLSVRLEPTLIELEREQEDLLIIGHASVIRCLLAYLIGLPAPEVPAIEVARGDLIEVVPTSYGVRSQSYHFWDGPGRTEESGHESEGGMTEDGGEWSTGARNFYENYAEDTSGKRRDSATSRDPEWPEHDEPAGHDQSVKV